MTNPSRVAVKALVSPVVLGLAVAAAGWLTLAPASASADTTCEGQVATIVATADYQTLTGTDGPDVISTAGFLGVNVLAGDGDDLVCMDRGGGDGTPDQGAVHGGPGDDTLVADAPRDPHNNVPQLYGEAGNDVLRVKRGPALLSPGQGDDTIHAPAKPHLSYGLPRISVTFGTAAAGVRINVAAGTIRGEGHDTFTGVLGFEGTPAPDRFTGGPHADYFEDRSGYDSTKPATDFVQGRGGDDHLTDYHGTIEGGPGNDQLLGWHDSVRGGAGRDEILISGGGSAQAGPGADVIYTSIDEENPPALPTSRFSLHGDGGPDTIFLTSPQDEGGYWACLTGVLCRFHADGGSGHDVLSFQYVGGGVHLDLARRQATYSKGARAGVAHFEKVEGSPFADVLKGTRHADHLDGDEGPDRLFGRAGPDILHGGPGHDVAFGGPGHDQCAAEIRRSC